MNKLDSQLTDSYFAISPTFRLDASAFPLTAGQCLEPAHRLIVLFPASEVDTPELIHRIWEIARSLKLNVLLLSLSNDFDEEARLRRKLISMAAIIKDPGISAEIMIEHGNDWVRQVRKILRTGDVVACYSGQKVGLMRKPLEQILSSSLEAQVYILSDCQPARKPDLTFISQVSSWLGSVAVIGSFLWAEVRVIQMPRDWAHTALLYFFIVMEVVIVWVWNSIFK